MRGAGSMGRSLKEAGTVLRDLATVQGARDEASLAVVVGAGRSGTHWLGETISTHPDVVGMIEAQPLFRWVRTAASEPSRAEALMPRIVRRYRALARRADARVVLDKSHPALFLAPEILAELPGTRFIAISRRVEAVVASGLRHPDVRKWVEDPRRIELPNPFLGVSRQNLDSYTALAPAGRLAVRWAATRHAIEEAERLFPDNFISIEYERLHSAGDEELERVTSFLGLTGPMPPLEPVRRSVDRWRDDLSSEDLDQIELGLELSRPEPFATR